MAMIEKNAKQQNRSHTLKMNCIPTIIYYVFDLFSTFGTFWVFSVLLDSEVSPQRGGEVEHLPAFFEHLAAQTTKLYHFEV